MCNDTSEAEERQGYDVGHSEASDPAKPQSVGAAGDGDGRDGRRDSASGERRAEDSD